MIGNKRSNYHYTKTQPTSNTVKEKQMEHQAQNPNTLVIHIKFQHTYLPTPKHHCQLPTKTKIRQSYTAPIKRKSFHD
jgi:hypothetical protein